MSASDSAARILTGKWSDAEKLALLCSIIRNSNVSPKWNEISVPAGRTLQASQKMYTEILKAADTVAMTGGISGAAITPSRKVPRGAKKAAAGEGDAASTPTKKRQRKPKAVSKETVKDGDDEDDDDGCMAKKVKMEQEDNGGLDAPIDDGEIA